MSNEKKEFNVGNLVVVTKDMNNSEDYFDKGSVGKVVRTLNEGVSVDVDYIEDKTYWSNKVWETEIEQLKHYTPIEDLPLWKSNHMYLNDEQQQALRKLLHRVQWDEEYAEKIWFGGVSSDTIVDAFTWGYTEEGQEFWESVNDQCDNKVIQQPDEIRSRATGRVVDDLCPPVTSCTIIIDGMNNTSEYFLQRAIDLQQERGKEYDNGQERSMGRVVEAFNIITGKQLSESEGWLFMQVLKDVRQWTKPEYHKDSAEDCVSYAALKAEALASGK